MCVSKNTSLCIVYCDLVATCQLTLQAHKVTSECDNIAFHIYPTLTQKRNFWDEIIYTEKNFKAGKTKKKNSCLGKDLW